MTVLTNCSFGLNIKLFNGKLFSDSNVRTQILKGTMKNVYWESLLHQQSSTQKIKLYHLIYCTCHSYILKRNTDN